MARTQTIVQLSDDLVSQLDAEAQRLGLSRSAVVRAAVETYLAEQRRDAVGEVVAEGYRRVPCVEPDEWGDLGRSADRATLETLQRLDAEERAQGLDW